MKIFKIVLPTLLMLGVTPNLVSAKVWTQKQLKQYKPLKANEGKRLISLTKAKLGDIHPAKPVKYFDIKLYDTYGKYEGGWSFDMATYTKLSSAEKKKIRSVKYTKSSSPFAQTFTLDAALLGTYNLHYLDIDSKVHTIVSKKDLLEFLGAIDTPAELSILFLGGYRGKIRYKKEGDIYTFRINDVSFEDYDAPGVPVCILSVFHMLMNSRDEILLRKSISEKSLFSEKECNKLLEE